MKNYVFKLLEKYDFEWKKIYKAMKNKEFVSNDEVEKYDSYEDFFTIIDEDYPKQLQSWATPPFVLFFKGNRDIFKNLNYSTLIYGGDNLTAYGEDLCKKVIKKCKEFDNTLITCNWTMTGKFCIAEAKKQKVKVISIIDHGRNFIFNSHNNPYVTYATLYLDHITSTEKRQKQATWLAAALCYRCIITELELDKAKFFMVDECLGMGKKVYAYPTNITNSNQGSNYLIKQGASILMN